MKKTIALSLMIVMIISTGVFAKDTIMLASSVDEMYQAPKLVESVRPDRVFYNTDREVEGFVTLELLVNEEGRVERARVLYKTSRLAVQNAFEAASQWRFDAATVNGTPVKAWVAYNLPFGPTDLTIHEQEDYAQRLEVNETVVASLRPETEILAAER